MSTIDWNIKRYKVGNAPEEYADRIAVELPVEIKVDGEPLVSLMRLPGMDRELAVGFCLTESVINDVSQVRSFKEEGSVIELELEPGEGEPMSVLHSVRSVHGGTDVPAIEDSNRGKITSRIQVAEETIYTLGERMTNAQEVFQLTAGAHGAGVFDPSGELVIAVEDVGRHNTLDKAVGWCALNDVPLDDKVMMLSGRISCEMALKAARAGIPVVVSMAAVTSLVVHMADKAGQTVVGFSNGRRFSAYTHTWRIVP